MDLIWIIIGFKIHQIHSTFLFIKPIPYICPISSQQWINVISIWIYFRISSAVHDIPNQLFAVLNDRSCLPTNHGIIWILFYIFVLYPIKTMYVTWGGGGGSPLNTSVSHVSFNKTSRVLKPIRGFGTSKPNERTYQKWTRDWSGKIKRKKNNPYTARGASLPFGFIFAFPIQIIFLPTTIGSNIIPYKLIQDTGAVGKVVTIKFVLIDPIPNYFFQPS